MFRLFLRSLISAILLVGLLSAPVPVTASSVGAFATGGNSTAMADMPGMEMGGMEAGGDCCKAPQLPPADCGKTCPMAFGCLSQCFTGMAVDAGVRSLPTVGRVPVWPLRDRHRSRLPSAGPYEPPRA